jgi:prephenate dehydrogenase
MSAAREAFDEDRAAIETPQRVIDHAEVSRVMPTDHDRVIAIVSQIVERLVRREA